MARGFQTPPENQGPIVEVSYCCCGDQIVRWSHDRSDGTDCYAVAGVEDDEAWYETYEQANGEPPVDEDRWTVISSRQAWRLYEDHD